MIPRRKNTQTIDASWFNSIAEAISERELEYAITDNETATALDQQEFDGDEVSSVSYEYEVIRGSTIHANGRGVLQCKFGTWKWIDLGYTIEEEDLEHGLTFSVAQAGTIGTLKVATSAGPGAGTLKLKRKAFNA